MNPMIFDIDLSPPCPRYFNTLGAANSIKKINKQTTRMAHKTIELLFQSLDIMDKFISSEIDPGPAKRGIASGLKEMSSFLIDSSLTGP